MMSLVYYLRVIAAVWMRPGDRAAAGDGGRLAGGGCHPGAARLPQRPRWSRSRSWPPPRRSSSGSSRARCWTSPRTPAARSASAPVGELAIYVRGVPRIAQVQRWRAASTPVAAHLALEALEAPLGLAVDERHRRRDRRVHRGDPVEHLERDGAVARVALAARAQLDQVHRLAGVEVEHVADPVGERHRVGRLSTRPSPRSRSCSARLSLEPFAVGVAVPGRLDLFGDVGAEIAVPSRCHSHVSIRCRCRSRNAP